MAPRSPSKSHSGRPTAPPQPLSSDPTPRTDDSSSASASTSSNSNSGNNAQRPPRRAQTFPSASPLDEKDEPDLKPEASDAFENNDDSDSEEVLEAGRASIELDVLPIELITLTDSFVESLSAKVHSSPPSIDKLSQLFQDFYAQASTHINTHISALATRQSRDASPAPSATSISSAASRLRSKASSLSASKEKLRPETEQPMLTPEELADRKQARKALEVKRHLLEEAVERRLCESIYDKIYRHKSTQDEAQDDKLRSKTAALSLVGIGPADLGIDLGEKAEAADWSATAQTEQIRTRLEQARKDLVRMNESRYPLGKLNHLKAAHRSIVDTIAHFHPSASADEIMPMLIFTLISLPPEDLHIVSDIHFIQNFRWEHKLTGEAAYCLTNLEATISFLETVDLTTLRSDELPSGPSKPQLATAKTDTFPPAYSQGLTPATAATAETTKSTATGVSTATVDKPSSLSAALKSTSPNRSRRLSDLVNTPAQAFGAASDAVFATADQGLKNVTNSLGDSYKFLLGKLREHQDNPSESIKVPRTLDDARKLVSTPPPDEDGSINGADDSDLSKSVREDRVLNLIGGRRDRSTDSVRSGRSASSSKLNKVLFADEAGKSGQPTQAQGQTQGQNPAMLDQMRNHITSSFNPMARLSNQIGMIRSFGRNVSTPPATSSASPAAASAPSGTAASGDADKTTEGGDLGTAFPDIAAALPPKSSLPKIHPPNKRFMDIQNPGDLKIGEVLELLRDYRRLAEALKKMDAFEG